MDVVVDGSDRWAQVCSESFVPLAVAGTSPAFRSRLHQVRLADGVSATRVWTEPSEVVRTQRLTRSEPRDDLLLSVQLGGSATIHQHGRAARLTPGSASLYDAASPYRLSFDGRMSQLVLQVPRTAIPARIPIAERTAVALRPTGPDVALVDLLRRLVTAADDDAGTTSGAYAQAVTALLGALLDREGQRPERHETGEADGRALVRGTARAVIERRFADPALDAGLLAHACGVSIRLLQLAFEADGDSPAAAIRARRLEHAHDALTAGATVAEAAARSGFLDLGTFTRACRRRFGVTPSELKRAG